MDNNLLEQIKKIEKKEIKVDSDVLLLMLFDAAILGMTRKKDISETLVKKYVELIES